MDLNQYNMWYATLVYTNEKLLTVVSNVLVTKIIISYFEHRGE